MSYQPVTIPVNGVYLCNVCVVDLARERRAISLSVRNAVIETLKLGRLTPERSIRSRSIECACRLPILSAPKRQAQENPDEERYTKIDSQSKNTDSDDQGVRLRLFKTRST